METDEASSLDVLLSSAATLPRGSGTFISREINITIVVIARQ